MAKKKQQVEQAQAEQDKRETLIAKRDFVICHNDYLRKICAGEDISDVPAVYHPNLKTERVL